LPDVPVFDALAPAVDAAFAHASPGDVLLFSPGFASFGLFKNEYDRNDQFLALVEKRK
jgi:UDP-N-acetylmuramoylalanine--D-glutamate ligase